MIRVDYINQEPVMCFPTPILDFNKIKQDCIEFSTGDSVNFKEGSRVPTSTYFYRYNENLLILDIDREIPIAHIIEGSMVIKTINIDNLNTEDILKSEQVIDIHGTELKVNSISDIQRLITEFIENKKQIKCTYTDTRLKLIELIDSSDRMRELDRVAGTNEVIKYINKDNFIKIKSKLTFMPNFRNLNINNYKELLMNTNNLNSFIIISNILEEEFYNDFKVKNKEHAITLSSCDKRVALLRNEFNNKWYKEDCYVKEKKLGALFDCLNEMICAKTYEKEELDFVECLITKYMLENDDLLDSFIEWLDLPIIDQNEIRDTFTEIADTWTTKVLLKNT